MPNRTSQPESEWKSQWRRDLEQWRETQRHAPKRAKAHSGPRCSSQPTPKPKREPRAPKRPKMRTLCACGRVIRKQTELYCFRCLTSPRLRDDARKCAADGCGRTLNRNNKSGVCKQHGQALYRKWRDERIRGERPTCQYQADGMRCIQKLYRDNPLGLCRFHSGHRLGSEYRHLTPLMVPLE